MKFTNLDLNRIDLSDERFRISRHFTLNELTASIKRAGLLNPPVLTQRENKLVVVSGWKRIMACHKLTFSTIPVFISPETDDLKVFELPIYENLTIREYSQVEKAEIIAKLSDFGANREDIMRRFLPLLSIPLRSRYIHLYKKAAALEPELKAVLHLKDPDIIVLELLSGMHRSERQMLLPLLVPLGKNKVKELVLHISELAKKDAVSVINILERPETTAVCGERLSPMQKADNVRKLVKAWLNPAQNAWKQAFELVLKELEVSQGIVISAAPFFEEQDLSLNFSFKSREDFLRKLAELKKLAGKKEFNGLFDFKTDD